MEKKRAPLNRTIILEQEDWEKSKDYFFELTTKTNSEIIKNKLLPQDLFSILDYLPDHFVDLLIIDPPYNLSKNFNSNQFRQMDSLEYENWIESWLYKMLRVLKPEASVYICCDWKSSNAVYNIASKYFKVQNRITWEREKGRGAKKNWKNCLEDIWFCTLGDNFTFNIGDVKIARRVLAPYKDKNGDPKDWINTDKSKIRITHPSNLWTDITVPFWSMPENTDHPTQKPEKLLAKIILASSNEGDMVFDPFAGSGTTLVTSQKLNRNFCGVEKDKTFATLTAKRLFMAEKDKSIQGYEDGVFWERNSLKK
jgi:site-specific DNA-methyltransferase (adenine-specific)